jgi:hypothetical protein
VSTEQVAAVAFALVVAALAASGAVVAWRVLARARNSLAALATTLDKGGPRFATQLREGRAQLAIVDAQTEHALLILGTLDDRMDRATAELAATRVASGRLRVRLIEGRLTIARLRQLVGLAMRLGELRRVFL